MKRQHGTWARRQVSRPAAEWRWDQAYQQLLALLPRVSAFLAPIL